MGAAAPIDAIVRARTLDEYVGQERLKRHLSIKIDAAINEKRMFDHTLLIAPAGAGKTTLASIIAEQLGDPFHEIEMAKNYKAKDLMWFIENWEGGVLLLDEIHRACDDVQNMLHTALGGEIRYLDEVVDTKHVTFIAATTKHQRSLLSEPLLSRFRYQPAFEPYTDDELGEILQGMAQRAGVEVSAEVCRELAPAATGTPRQAASLVAAIRDLVATGREVTAPAVLEFAQLDAEGLSSDHLDYLRTLHTVGDRMGVKPLSNLLGLSPAAMDNLERLLFLKGFVRMESTGRRITPLGKEKIGVRAKLGVSRLSA